MVLGQKAYCKSLPTLSLCERCTPQQSQVGKGLGRFSVIVKYSDTDRETATAGYVDK